MFFYSLQRTCDIYSRLLHSAAENMNRLETSRDVVRASLKNSVQDWLSHWQQVGLSYIWFILVTHIGTNGGVCCNTSNWMITLLELLLPTQEQPLDNNPWLMNQLAKFLVTIKLSMKKSLSSVLQFTKGGYTCGQYWFNILDDRKFGHLTCIII